MMNVIDWFRDAPTTRPKADAFERDARARLTGRTGGEALALVLAEVLRLRAELRQSKARGWAGDE